MFSKILCKSIEVADVASIDPDEVASLADEVGHNLATINASIKAVGSLARGKGKYLKPEDWQKLNCDRADLAGLHQALLRRRSEIREAEKRERLDRETQGLSLADHFQQVVRLEASPIDYQRWVLQAEMRRTAELRCNYRKREAA